MTVQNPSIEVIPATAAERPVVRNLMELYLYDFSEFDGAEIGPFGLYGYPYLDNYWTEPTRFPFLVRVDGQLAGFVLVARYNYFTGLLPNASAECPWVIAEFFILRKYRRQGIGEGSPAAPSPASPATGRSARLPKMRTPPPSGAK
jgi:hypothetical protein